MFGRWLWGTACLHLICSVASAQGRNAEAAATRVIYPTAYVQHCSRVDDLLRETCARIGRHLPAKNAKNCELPARTFEARTAGHYRAFKDSFRVEIKANEAKIEAVQQKTRKAFERQFAHVRARQVST